MEVLRILFNMSITGSIIFLIFSLIKPLTTAVKNSGNQLKSRLENMMFSFKISRKKHIISLLVSVLMFISGIIVACSILPNKAIGENNSFVVYIKEDGLYYSYLNGEEEIKIHEGKEFIYERGNLRDEKK